MTIVKSIGYGLALAAVTIVAGGYLLLVFANDELLAAVIGSDD